MFGFDTCCCGTQFYTQGADPQYYTVNGNIGTYFAASNAAFVLAGSTTNNGHVFDSVNKKYYAVRNNQSTLLRADEDLTNVVVAFTFDPSFTFQGVGGSIALHKPNQHIYYRARKQPSTNFQIRRVGFNGIGDTSIIDLDVGYGSQNDSIVISEAQGYVFYEEDDGSTALMLKIRRCNLDGSGAIDLYSTPTPFPYIPRDFASDDTNQLIYFDGSLTAIYSLPYAGGTPTTLITRGVAPLPALSGTVNYVLRMADYSPINNKIYFKLAALGSDPTNQGLWSCNPDGSGAVPEVVYPNLVDSVTGLPNSDVTANSRWRLGTGY